MILRAGHAPGRLTLRNRGMAFIRFHIPAPHHPIVQGGQRHLPTKPHAACCHKKNNTDAP